VLLRVSIWWRVWTGSSMTLLLASLWLHE
jgi:hypothetical protein